MRRFYSLQLLSDEGVSRSEKLILFFMSAHRVRRYHFLNKAESHGMTMQEYLNEIEHAASKTLRLARSEHLKLEELHAHLAKLKAEIAESQRRIQWLIDNPEIDDDFQSTAMHWESYFGPEKELFYGDKSKEELEEWVGLRRFSTSALNGSLLQFGKQGIAIVHGQLSLCPDGRYIGSQALKNVIWQCRNQALHWEDGNFTTPVVACFEALEREAGLQFGEFRSRNMATDVLRVLGWQDFASFQSDMLLLA